ncbi:MAG: hypothetical protein AAF394_04325, partial [Planctomycetota bacterium]
LFFTVLVPLVILGWTSRCIQCGGKLHSYTVKSDHTDLLILNELIPDCKTVHPTTAVSVTECRNCQRFSYYALGLGRGEGGIYLFATLKLHRRLDAIQQEEDAIPHY